MGGYKFREVVSVRRADAPNVYEEEAEDLDVYDDEDEFVERRLECFSVDTSKACYDDPFDGGVTGHDEMKVVVSIVSLKQKIQTQ